MNNKYALFTLVTLATVILLIHTIQFADAKNSEARDQMKAQSEAIKKGIKANAQVGTPTQETRAQLEANSKTQVMTDADCKRKFGPEFQKGVGKRLCINSMSGKASGGTTSNEVKPVFGCPPDCPTQKNIPNNNKVTKNNDVSLKGKAWNQLKAIGRSGGWGGN